MAEANSPPWGPIKGPISRLVMVFLIKFRNEDGVCCRLQRELAADVDASHESVRQAVLKLEELDLIRRQPGSYRSNEGTYTANCYELSLAHRDVRALIEYFDPRPRSGEQIAHSPYPNQPNDIGPHHSTGTGENGELGNDQANPSQLNGAGAYNDRARAGVRPNPSSHPSFREYPWPSDEMRAQAEQILAVCGPGLADVDRYHMCMWPSLESLLMDRWGDPEFLRLHAVPMVMKKTEQVREEGKRLKDFYPIDRSIDEVHAQRSAQVYGAASTNEHRTKKTTKYSGNSTPSNPTIIDARVRATRRNVERMRLGDFCHTDIRLSDRQCFHDGGEARERVCAQALAEEEQLLAALPSSPLKSPDL